MKRKLKITLGILLALTLVVMIAGRVWLGTWVSRGRLIAEMEKAWNCRAELADTSLSVLNTPALVEVHGMKLAPRTDEVMKPLSERTTFDPEQALLTAGKIDLLVSKCDLLQRRANIQRLHVQDFNLRDQEQFVFGGKEGDWHAGLLDDLFARPDDYEEDSPERKTSLLPPRRGILSPAAIASSPGEQGLLLHKKKKKKTRQRERRPFKAADLKFALAADEVSVGNANIDLTELRLHLDDDDTIKGRTERHTQFKQVEVALNNLDVNPDNLARHNRCDMKFSGRIELDQKVKIGDDPPFSRRLVQLDLTGAGFIKPFEPETGLWNPDWNVDVRLAKGSQLGGVNLKDALRENDLKKIMEWGMDIDDVLLGGVIGDEAAVKVHYLRGGKLIVQDVSRFVFPEYEITIEAKSWFDTHEDKHRAKGSLLLGKKLTDRALVAMETKLKSEGRERYNLSDGLAEMGSALAIAAAKKLLVTEDGRLEFKFISQDRLSKPVVKWDNPLSDVASFFKNSGKSLLDSILKNKTDEEKNSDG